MDASTYLREKIAEQADEQRVLREKALFERDVWRGRAERMEAALVAMLRESDALVEATQIGLNHGQWTEAHLKTDELDVTSKAAKEMLKRSGESFG